MEKQEIRTVIKYSTGVRYASITDLIKWINAVKKK